MDMAGEWWFEFAALIGGVILPCHTIFLSSAKTSVVAAVSRS
jgi:hypothetical protein